MTISCGPIILAVANLGCATPIPIPMQLLTKLANLLPRCPCSADQNTTRLHSPHFAGGPPLMRSAPCLRDPASPDPFATRSIVVGIDSYSDVMIAHRDLVYNIRPIYETVQTGAGDFSSRLPRNFHSEFSKLMIWTLSAMCIASNVVYPCSPTIPMPISLSTPPWMWT